MLAAPPKSSRCASTILMCISQSAPSSVRSTFSGGQQAYLLVFFIVDGGCCNGGFLATMADPDKSIMHPNNGILLLHNYLCVGERQFGVIPLAHHREILIHYISFYFPTAQ